MKTKGYRSWIAFGSVAALVAIAMALVIPAYSYLPQLMQVTSQNPLVTSGQPGFACASIYGQNCVVWDFSAFPVQWDLNPTTGSNISGTTTVHDVIAASFATWAGAPNAALSGVVTEGPQSSVSDANAAPAGLNLICFVCNGSDQTIFSDTSTIAVTLTTTANAPGQPNGHGGTSTFGGQILQGIILFNPANQFVTNGTPGSNQSDLQTIATHEIGHFLGLDHSGVIAALMYPYAAVTKTQLTYDDVAAVSTLYPSTTGQTYPTGSISGTVTLSGSPVFGAHVYAESTSNLQLFQLPNITKSAVGALTKPDGTYTITGLPADNYIVFAEPLDGPVDQTNISGFSLVYATSAVQTNFTTRWH
ncbi:MAG TPA: matrixin family metalloprotease [Terriglobales bacterium]|nr:matrixin family metalloprotease [Terriglobales bacterium]